MTMSASHLLDKKRVLLFDFDGTLFDTSKLKAVISEQLHSYTANTDLLWETEKKLRDRRYHLIETMRVFCEQIGVAQVQHTILDIFLHQNFPAFIFPDVIKNLKALHEENVIALFSEGDETYQQVKIYQSYLSELFDFIYIYHRKLPHLDEVVSFFSDKEIWYIDNHITKLQKAQEKFPPLKTIWLNREHLRSTIEYVPDMHISTLDELLLR